MKIDMYRRFDREKKLRKNVVLQLICKLALLSVRVSVHAENNFRNNI